MQAPRPAHYEMVGRDSLNDYDRMPIGKHAGELMMDVQDGYYRWLLKQDWLDEWPALSAYVRARDWGDEDDDGPDEDPYNWTDEDR